MRLVSETKLDGHVGHHGGIGHAPQGGFGHGGFGHAPHGFEFGHGAPIVNHAQGHHHHHHEPHGHIHEPIKHHDHGIG